MGDFDNWSYDKFINDTLDQEITKYVNKQANLIKMESTKWEILGEPESEHSEDYLEGHAVGHGEGFDDGIDAAINVLVENPDLSYEEVVEMVLNLKG